MKKQFIIPVKYYNIYGNDEDFIKQMIFSQEKGWYLQISSHKSLMFSVVNSLIRNLIFSKKNI
jgi:hypothetical protein